MEFSFSPGGICDLGSPKTVNFWPLKIDAWRLSSSWGPVTFQGRAWKIHPWRLTWQAGKSPFLIGSIHLHSWWISQPVMLFLGAGGIPAFSIRANELTEVTGLRNFHWIVLVANSVEVISCVCFCNGWLRYLFWFVGYSRCSTRLMNLHDQIDINMTLFVHGELSLQKQCVTALGGGQY